MTDDPTLDPALTSWVPGAEGSDFPVQNLPYGIFSVGGDPPRVGVAIGDHVCDLSALALEGLFDHQMEQPAALFSAGLLNGFLARGRPVWRAARARVSQLLEDSNREIRDHGGLAERVLHRREDARMHLPFAAGDYVDFYSSIHHATNLGRMFRPDDEPLMPNWRHLPVGYHGRASTLVISGTPVVRPQGQTAPGSDGRPAFGPSRRLDFELEVGFVTGPGQPMGQAIGANRTDEHIFGFVLVNDWSARDIQAWEYRPLGPFLGKSFATSVSGWVVPLDALAPYRVAQPAQDPEPVDYLRTRDDWGLDIQLEVLLGAGDGEPQRISRTTFADMYWTPAQQLAHATVNGTAIRPGDLYASGTVSGTDAGTYGSMIELTGNGQQPLRLAGGVERGFLEDGDQVIMRGWCETKDRPRIGFGEVAGTVLPAT